MSKTANQKLKILYIYDILMRETDEEHPLSAKELIERLNVLGVSAERKSVYSDIEALKLFGADIESAARGYYIASREFELPELKLLADCVSASKFITEKKSEKLIKKIESLASRHDAAKLQRQVFITDRIKLGNEGIYYNVDTISEAINNDKKISFGYFEYDADKKKRFRNGGRDYVVSPYSLTVSDENYYLISHSPKHEKLTHFRVDRMNAIKILDEARTPVEDVMGKGFSIGEYSKKVFSMYSGESMRVTLLCENSMVNPVIDRFGDRVFIEKNGDGSFKVSVNVDISPTFFAWVFTFAGKIKIISPQSVVESFNETLKKF